METIALLLVALLVLLFKNTVWQSVKAAVQQVRASAPRTTSTKLHEADIESSSQLAQQRPSRAREKLVNWLTRKDKPTSE
jgi:hypothetical protein